MRGPGIVVVGLLGLTLALVAVYVLTNNAIAQRTATLTTLKTQVAQEQAQAARMANYAQFARLAEERTQTVKQIAGSRFDWHGALSDLSRVMPADASLQSLVATVAPTAAGGGAGGSSGSGLRGAISAPAFELTGCTKTQDDVARLMSRLRLINGVTRVTLGSSQKQDSGQSAVTVSSAGASGSEGCGLDTPSFDLVVFFEAPPGALTTAPQPASTVTSTPATTSASSTATTATTTSASRTATTGTTAPVSATPAKPAGAP